ncbi:MAG: DNA-processing protein DprA [Patescibacteria group bacterium]|nr:DNA-processing protein DprA [Patescibacteria group bacterium]
MQKDRSQQNDSKYLFAFALIPEIGSARFEKIEKAFENFEAGWKASPTELTKAGLDKKTVSVIDEKRSRIDVEREYSMFLQSKIEMIHRKQKDFPAQLKQIKTSPFLLFCLGNKSLLAKKQLAIVGTRNPTKYGQITTSKLATEISSAGLVITSGMAQGIDSFAHNAALDAENKTIAVLGGGISRVANNTRAKQMIEKILYQDGLVVSEYQPNFDANKFTFPARNRIISGLSLGVLVVEAGEKSGSLITAHCALEQNREVLAVPGSIFSSQSLGTNWLLGQGAQIVRNSKDILETFNFTSSTQPKRQDPVFDDEIQQKIFDRLSFEPVHIDNLARKCHLDSSSVTAKISILELKGLIKNVGGNMFIRQ